MLYDFILHFTSVVKIYYKNDFKYFSKKLLKLFGIYVKRFKNLKAFNGSQI